MSIRGIIANGNRSATNFRVDAARPGPDGSLQIELQFPRRTEFAHDTKGQLKEGELENIAQQHVITPEEESKIAKMGHKLKDMGFSPLQTDKGENYENCGAGKCRVYIALPEGMKHRAAVEKIAKMLKGVGNGVSTQDR